MLTDEELATHEHDHRGRLVLRKNRSGAVCVVEQCARCGRVVRNVKKDPNNLPAEWFDEKLEAECNERVSAYWNGIRVEMAARFDRDGEARRRRRDEYMASPRWSAKRAAVLSDAGYKCEAKMAGCLGRADAVHHKSYEHIGNEPSWELAAVCAHCHATIHGRLDDDGAEIAASLFASRYNNHARR